jgi:AAA+ superfamily predicted ATPase
MNCYRVDVVFDCGEEDEEDASYVRRRGRGSWEGRCREQSLQLYDATSRGLIVAGASRDGYEGTWEARLYALEMQDGLLAQELDGYIDTCFSEQLERYGRSSMAVSTQIVTPVRFWENASSTYNSRSDFYNTVAQDCGLRDLYDAPRRMGPSRIVENLIKTDKCKDELLAAVGKYNCTPAAAPELENIYAGGCSNAQGNPVHYLVRSSDIDVRMGLADVIASALHNAGRIEPRWYLRLELEPETGMSPAMLNGAYKASKGGVIVVDYLAPEEAYGGAVSRNLAIVNELCELAVTHQHDVLTVLCLKDDADKTRRAFLERLEDLCFVELTQQVLQGDEARAYIRNKARGLGFTPTRALYAAIKDDECAYTPRDLDKAFASWRSRQLKTRVYPQYKELLGANKLAARAAAVGSAYRELQEMVGLEEAKRVVQQAIDFHKARRVFKGAGLEQDNTAKHMVFYGNPGTAKTSVARLFAQICKDNGLLSVGDLVECGRADLVSKWLGGTAPQVREKFKEAKGSVLFIDEAYSLAEERDGLYGDEAINTIVQEMENNREDMIVIFAGYPDKMEGFLVKNPGLRSRIAFHVPFEDYNVQELWQITELIAARKKRRLAPGVRDKLMPIYHEALRTVDFGGGRFVRNMVEQAELAQASRLVQMDVDTVTPDDLQLLLPQDFTPPKTLGTQRHQIGFAA